MKQKSFNATNKLIHKSLITIIIFLLTNSLFADIVTLKNGKVILNARTQIKKDKVLIVSLEGKQESYLKSQVKSIRFKPILVTSPKTEADRLANDKEKIRVAEALVDAGDWEPTQEQKLTLAVLHLKAGKGVEESEVETIAELITTNLVKTKLFIVIDKTNLEKILKSKSDSNCTSEKDCNTSTLATYLNASKFLTGTVTKVKDKYFINGHIANSKDNSIDFAETATADNPNKFSESSEIFAKKVAGGILDIYDSSVTTKDKYYFLTYMGKSALIPGWGQYKAGQENNNSFQKWKGFGFGILFLASAINYYTKLQAYNKEKSEYNSIHNLFYLIPLGSSLEQGFYIRDRNAYSEFEKSGIEAERSLLILGAVYLINLVDSAFPEKRFLGLGAMPKKKQTGFNFNLKPINQLAISQNAINQKEIFYEVSYSFNY